MNETTERNQDLDDIAMSSGQLNQPRGHALVKPTLPGIVENVVGAQAVAVYRDERKVMDKLRVLAAMAGTDWFYRFPVKNNRSGTTDWIEGPSIKLANDVARVYGNNVNEIRAIDLGDAWEFYARFTDIETGFSMQRAYRQRKSQVSMKTRDADRQLDIAYQIGQSKAIRNCIVSSLQIFADYAFEHARNSLVERIGKDLPTWRERTLEGLAKIPVDVHRVERVVGVPAAKWLAPNIAAIVSMMQSIADGMASVDEVFPPLEAAAVTPNPTAAGREGGGAQESGASANARQEHETATPAAADPLSVAYERGKQARAAAHKRTDVPAEYKEPGHIKECDAWLFGFDGKPLPGKLV